MKGAIRSLHYKILIKILKQWSLPSYLSSIIEAYFECVNYIGIRAAGALSPLIGAFYWHSLDMAMEKFCKRGKAVYIRYMDDYVIVTRKRWHLKQAISKMHTILKDLLLYIHPTKRAIGRLEKGINFLEYHLHPKRKLRPSSTALELFALHFHRLYEQEESSVVLWSYAKKWTSRLWGDLYEYFSFKGGVKRYFYYALRRNAITNIQLPYEASRFT